MTTAESNPTSAVDRIIARIDQAVTSDNPESICQQVKSALEEVMRGGGVVLDKSMITPVDSGYGRHLLHRDPAGRYTIVIMCWGPGQGTPIHDHSGMWCVECVTMGKIRVHSYQMFDLGGDRARFTPETQVVAGVGQAGTLIPPFDYHVIENPFEDVAVTMHVYGGEMETCNIFHREEEGSDCYRREARELSYTAC